MNKTDLVLQLGAIHSHATFLHMRGLTSNDDTLRTSAAAIAQRTHNLIDALATCTLTDHRVPLPHQKRIPIPIPITTKEETP